MSRGNLDKLRRSSKYKRWQKKVFIKDGFKCVECGATDNLTADHIIPLVQAPELAYVVSNGQTLCDSCRVKGMLKQWNNGELKSKKKRVGAVV